MTNIFKIGFHFGESLFFIAIYLIKKLYFINQNKELRFNLILSHYKII